MINGAVAGTVEEPGELRTLPYQEPLRMWASHGTGVRCNLCGRIIEAQDIEYEVELAPVSNPRGLHFHFKCYRAWESQA